MDLCTLYSAYNIASQLKPSFSHLPVLPFIVFNGTLSLQFSLKLNTVSGHLPVYIVCYCWYNISYTMQRRACTNFHRCSYSQPSIIIFMREFTRFMNIERFCGQEKIMRIDQKNLDKFNPCTKKCAQPIATSICKQQAKHYARVYRIAGNFCGVLIFVIFVVDLAVTKFSHP